MQSKRQKSSFKEKEDYCNEINHGKIRGERFWSFSSSRVYSFKFGGITNVMSSNFITLNK